MKWRKRDMVLKIQKRFIKKILIIDDDPTMAKGIRLILKSDYIVVVKNNTFEALSSIKEEMPDLIITDLFLDEMNGLDIYKKFNQDIPTIIMTGSTDTKLAQKAKQTAGTSYIEKPFAPEMLKDKINDLLKIREIIQSKKTKNRGVNK